MPTVKTSTSIKATAATLTSGDTLEVAAGVYDECHINDIPSNCRIVAVGGPVWIRPSSGDCCIWLNQMQSNIEFDGINLDATNTNNGALKIEGWSCAQGNPHHIVFKNAEIIGSRDYSTIAIIFAGLEPGIIGGNQLINCKIHGGGIYDRDHGIYIQSSDNLVADCEFYDLAGAGVQFYNGYGIPQSGNIVRGTTIHSLRQGCSGDNGAPGRHAGVYAYSQNNLSIQGCTIRDIPNCGGGATGIEISADNVVVDACTITGVQGYAVCGTSGSGNVVRNSSLSGNEGEITGDVASENNNAGGGPPPTEPSKEMPSEPGSRVPPEAYLVDNDGGQWTLSAGRVLCNGTDSGGAGSELLWQNSLIYTFGGDSAWWQYTSATGWTLAPADPTGGSGGGEPTSAPGTRVPPTEYIIDLESAKWTLSGVRVLRNGEDSGGAGSELLWQNSLIYTFGSDSAWWQYTSDTGWTLAPGDPTGGSGGGELEEGYEQEGEAGSRPAEG